MSDVVISAKNVKKWFDKKEVLTGLDIEIERGTVTGLLGKNGCGKSTLIKCLLGLIATSSGKVELLGENGWDLSADAKSRIGYVPQEPQLYPWMRIKQLVDYHAAFYPNWDKNLSDSLLDRWELNPTERVGPLSAGQLHKLALVLAMGHSPELLILDEPVASLDPVARREFLAEILKISYDENRAVLFSTHITSDLERVADRVAIMREGKIVYHDRLDDLKESVKRLRISAQKALPSSFAVPGALRVEVSGQQAIVAVSDIKNGFVDELRETWTAEVAVEDLNLEDIFLELHDA